MSLTAGTSLQNGKYVIQSVLDQSDFGITYQAAHAYLDQSVILQTLESNPADPEKLARFQQQFLAGVRRLSKGEHSYPGKVLDYFVEAQLPYVVLEYVLGQPLPKVLDWLLSPQKLDPGNTSGIHDQIYTDFGNTNLGKTDESQLITDQRETNQREMAIAPGAALMHTTNGAIPDAAKTPYFEVPDAGTPNIGIGNIHSSAQLSQNTQLNPTKATVVVAPNASRRSPSGRSKTSPWVPASLMLTTVIAGLAGAGFGWSLRFHPTTQEHPIFKNEQDFPPTPGWPIQEEGDRSLSTSDWERPTDTANEAPVRRERSSIQEVAPAEPIGEDKIQLPEAEVIPKTPSEFEGGDAFPSGEFPPEPTAESLPPEPSYNPPVDIAPAPEIEVAPPAPAVPDPIAPLTEPPIQ